MGPEACSTARIGRLSREVAVRDAFANELATAVGRIHENDINSDADWIPVGG